MAKNLPIFYIGVNISINNQNIQRRMKNKCPLRFTKPSLDSTAYNLILMLCQIDEYYVLMMGLTD